MPYQGPFPIMSCPKFRSTRSWTGLEPLNMISNTDEDIFPHTRVTLSQQSHWRRMKINSLMGRVVSLSLRVSTLIFWGHFICFLITLIRMSPPSSLKVRMLWPPQKASWFTCAQILPGKEKVTARVMQHVPLITTHYWSLSHLASNGVAVLTNDAQVSVVRQGHLMEYWNTGRSSVSLLLPHRWSMPGIT